MQQLETINQLDRALRYARSHLNADVTAQRLLILLAVYQHEGLSQRDLLSHLESTSITALSRNIADLSRLTTKKPLDRNCSSCVRIPPTCVSNASS